MLSYHLVKSMYWMPNYTNLIDLIILGENCVY